MLPDIVQDNCTDAAKRLGCQFIESFFFRAALEAGFGTRSEDKAREINLAWSRGGYDNLPHWVKKFALDVCDGQHVKHKEVIKSQA